jgi:hypothetical protein
VARICLAPRRPQRLLRMRLAWLFQLPVGYLPGTFLTSDLTSDRQVQAPGQETFRAVLREGQDIIETRENPSLKRYVGARVSRAGRRVLVWPSLLGPSGPPPDFLARKRAGAVDKKVISINDHFFARSAP